MRVLYLNHTGQVSGAEHSLVDLVRALPKDVEPHVAAGEGKLSELLAAAGVQAHSLPATEGSLRLHPVRTPAEILRLAATGRRTRELVRDLRIDVVHANSIRSGLALRFAGRGVRGRTLVHVRDSHHPKSLSGLSLRAIGRGSRGLIANSAYTARTLEGSKAPVHVIHNGIDLERFESPPGASGPLRAELGIGASEVVLAVIAQITPWKAQDDAIRIAGLLRARGQRVKLLVIGAPLFTAVETRFDNRAYEETLHALAQGEGVPEDVVFLGHRDDVPALLAAIDLLLVPSWEEPFGRTILEAMAAGVPVAATSVGGPPEIIVEPGQGLLLAPRRPELWADEIAALLADRGRLREMARNGRSRVAAGFQAEAHARRVVALYEDVARSTPGF